MSVLKGRVEWVSYREGKVLLDKLGEGTSQAGRHALLLGKPISLVLKPSYQLHNKEIHHLVKERGGKEEEEERGKGSRYLMVIHIHVLASTQSREESVEWQYCVYKQRLPNKTSQVSSALTAVAAPLLSALTASAQCERAQQRRKR